MDASVRGVLAVKVLLPVLSVLPLLDEPAVFREAEEDGGEEALLACCWASCCC